MWALEENQFASFAVTPAKKAQIGELGIPRNPAEGGRRRAARGLPGPRRRRRSARGSETQLRCADPADLLRPVGAGGRSPPATGQSSDTSAFFFW
jgi:hypothetical protein